MTKNDLREFHKLLIGISTLYGKQLDEITFDIYWVALENFSFADISRAVKMHLQNPDTGQFMPKPADIVKYLHGDTKTQSLIAWSRVRRMISRVGIYSTIKFEDEFCNVVIHDMGGWVKLCTLDEKQTEFYAIEFQKRYQGYLISQREIDIKFLPGLHHGANEMHGQDQQQILFITNDEKLIEKKIDLLAQIEAPHNSQSTENRSISQILNLSGLD